MSEAGNRALDGIRAEIDSIDAAMHDLLIRRSAVIDELIAVKGADPLSVWLSLVPISKGVKGEPESRFRIPTTCQPSSIW